MGKFHLAKVVIDFRFPPPLWVWFGDVERMSKWIMKARPTTEVTHWEINKVLLSDKYLALVLQFAQRRVNVTWEAESVNLADFTDYCTHVQKAVHSVLDFTDYARIGVLLRIASEPFKDEKVAMRQNSEIVSKRMAQPAKYPNRIAMQEWLEEDSTTQIRRSIKVDLQNVQTPKEIKEGGEIKLGTTWQTTIEFDRFIQARIPKDTLTIDFINETAKDFEGFLQEAYGLDTKILVDKKEDKK